MNLAEAVTAQPTTMEWLMALFPPPNGYEWRQKDELLFEYRVVGGKWYPYPIHDHMRRGYERWVTDGAPEVEYLGRNWHLYAGNEEDQTEEIADWDLDPDDDGWDEGPDRQGGL